MMPCVALFIIWVELIWKFGFPHVEMYFSPCLEDGSECGSVTFHYFRLYSFSFQSAAELFLKMGLLTPAIDHTALVYACVCAQLALLSKYVHLKVKIIHDLQGKQYLWIFPFSFFFTLPFFLRLA